MFAALRGFLGILEQKFNIFFLFTLATGKVVKSTCVLVYQKEGKRSRNEFCE